MSQPGAYPYPPAPPAAPPPRNGLGTSALVLGIIGVLIGLIPLTFFFTIVLGILALIFGLVGFNRARKGLATNKVMAIIGAVLGLVALVLGIVGAIIVLGAVGQVARDVAAAAPTVQSGASAGSSDASTSGGADQPATAAPGDRVTVGHLTIVVAPLQDAELPFSDGPNACSTVTYENTGTETAPFNMFDWKVVSSNGVESTPTILTQGDGLQAGELRPGGTTSGQVCFDAAAEGSSLIYRSGLFGEPVEFSG